MFHLIFTEGKGRERLFQSSPVVEGTQGKRGGVEEEETGLLILPEGTGD